MRDDGSLPPHPGRLIKELYLERLGISVTDAAKALGVTRKSFSELINGHFAVSAEMALRLARALGTSAQMWLLLQMEFDLAQAGKRLEKVDIARLV